LSSSILLSALRRGESSTIDALRSALRHHGFACVRIDDDRHDEVLADAIEEAAALDGFRFPPIDDSQPNYTPIRRAAFQSLFHIATDCFGALFQGETVPAAIQSALSETRAGEQILFEDENEPFSVGQPFSESFFNLFNYNCGLLNPHADRSLLTVIKVRAGQNLGAKQSALWVQDPKGGWCNADTAIGPDEVVVLVGEDTATLSASMSMGLYAAEHAVRVDPVGEYVPHSHFRRDPATPREGNRISAAFILRHEVKPPSGM